MYNGFKSKLLLAAGACIVLFGAVLIFVLQKKCTTVSLGGDTLCVEVVSTEAAIVQGLSDRAEIGADGMLFIMPNTERYDFWMKDMHFPLDIVWIDADDIVTEITYNLTPETYPKTVRPEKPAHKVLEVPAGNAQTSWVGAVLKK